MKYFIRGKGGISLTQNDFIFQGGEGKVYGKGNSAYKIYDDLSKLIPEAKIDELKLITHPNVIRPEDIILNPKNIYVGFTMRWIKESVPMVKLFTNDFRNQRSISNDIITELIENMKEIIAHIHQSKCLIVDGNEFNYLTDDKTFKIPYFIDVNSYQTPSFPATALMPSVRDVHSKSFSELTDWFSFAVIACQLFVGIHPFKGTHPDYSRKNMGADLMFNRMKDNISIFNPKVSVPPSARDFSCIPKNYLSWFIELFEKGKRLSPPMKAGAVLTAVAGIRVIQSSDNFEIRHIRDFDSEILYHKVIYGIEITKTQEKIYVGKSEYPSDADTDVIFTPKKAKPVFVNIRDRLICFSEIRETQAKIHPLSLECTHKMIIDNTLYVRNGGNLTELALTDRPDGDISVSVKSTWNIMPYASEIYDGVIYQNILGKSYLMIPIPKKDGLSLCMNIHIPELENCRIINAKHENHVCIITAHKNYAYRRFVLKFDKDYKNYDCRITDDTDSAEINFTVLDNGIAIAINDDNSSEIFFNQKGNDRIDIIRDPVIQSSMKLCKDGIITKFFQHKGLFLIKKAKKV